MDVLKVVQQLRDLAADPQNRATIVRVSTGVLCGTLLHVENAPQSVWAASSLCQLGLSLRCGLRSTPHMCMGGVLFIMGIVTFEMSKRILVYVAHLDCVVLLLS